MLTFQLLMSLLKLVAPLNTPNILVMVLVFHEFILLMVVKLVQSSNINLKVFIADKFGVSVTADRFRLEHSAKIPPL